MSVTNIAVISTILAAIMGLTAVGVAAQEPAAPAPAEKLTDDQAISYGMGIQYGRSLKTLDRTIDREMVFHGIRDALDGKPPRLEDEEFRNLIRNAHQEAQKRRMSEQQKLIADNLAAQKAFLDENKSKQGITTLENGLQYKEIKPGTGKTPSMTDRVKIKYVGRLLDGSEFDNTEKRGGEGGAIESQVNKLPIPGLRQALLSMKEGGKWELYIPSNLGFGMQPMPKVGPNQLLVVEVELLKVLPPAPAPTPQHGPKPAAEPDVKPEVKPE